MISFLFNLFNAGIQCKSSMFIKIYADGLLCIIHWKICKMELWLIKISEVTIC